MRRRPTLSFHLVLHRLMKLPSFTAALLLVALPWADALGQVLPLAFNPAKAHDNFQTTNGVPISDTRNVPPGSDGRAPGPIPGPLGTLNQFQSLLGLSGTVTNKTFGTNAAKTVLVGLRTRAGAAYVGSSA